MEWIDSYQDARRNMSDAEKIYVKDKISLRRLEEDNLKKIKNGGSIGGKGGYSKEGCAQMNADFKSERDRSTNTREQRAKLAGVSTGAIRNQYSPAW